MTKQLLALHWKAARWGLLPWVVAAFGVPLLIVGRLNGEGALQSADIWQQMIPISPVFPLLAVAAGSTIALTAWSWDHRQGHVYALALPVPRWRYAWTKFLAGLTLAAIPAVALGVGGVIAASMVELPDLVQAYPGALAFRFYLATLAAYGVMFALAAGTMRTALIVLSVGLGAVFLGDGVVEFASRMLPALEGVRVTDLLLDLASQPASPFRVLTGNWLLFDV
jgi:hypothetical protein